MRWSALISSIVKNGIVALFEMLSVGDFKKSQYWCRRIIVYVHPIVVKFYHKLKNTKDTVVDSISSQRPRGYRGQVPHLYTQRKVRGSDSSRNCRGIVVSAVGESGTRPGAM